MKTETIGNLEQFSPQDTAVRLWIVGKLKEQRTPLLDGDDDPDYPEIDITQIDRIEFGQQTAGDCDSCFEQYPAISVWMLTAKDNLNRSQYSDYEIRIDDALDLINMYQEIADIEGKLGVCARCGVRFVNNSRKGVEDGVYLGVVAMLCPSCRSRTRIGAKTVEEFKASKAGES